MTFITADLCAYQTQLHTENLSKRCFGVSDNDTRNSIYHNAFLDHELLQAVVLFYATE